MPIVTRSKKRKGMDPNQATSLADLNDTMGMMVMYDPQPPMVQNVWEDLNEMPTTNSMEAFMCLPRHAQMVSAIISQNCLAILANYV